MTRPTETQNPLVAARRALRPAILCAVALSSFANLAALAVPLYSIQIYDRVLTSRNLTTLAMVTAITAILLVVYAALDALRGAILNRASVGFDRSLSATAFDALFRARMTDPQMSDGRPLRDVDGVRNFIASGGLAALLDLPWVPIFIALSFAIHAALGLVALVGSLLIAATALATEALTRRPTLAAAHHAANSQRHSGDVLRCAETVRALGMQAAMRDIWMRHHEASLAEQAASAGLSDTLTGITKLIRQSVQIAIMGVAAWLVIDGAINAGVIFAASLMIGRALAPVEQTVGNWRRVVAAREAWQSLRRLFATAAEETVPLELPRPTGALSVEGIYVAAPGSRRPLVKNVSFALAAGETLVVAGASGCGKSTLVRALTGVWSALGGAVRLDGAALTQWNPDQLGRHIGYVPQEVVLFEGTVAQNIARHGMPDAAEVVRAAQAAGVHEAILRLPQGYETSVGIAGETLSGGMRQRVALARALYGNPCLVVLDEPNANLDSMGDQALGEALLRLKAASKTVIVVSHKVGIAAAADKMLVMADGMVQAFGSRDEILQGMVRPRVVAGNDVAA
jgi:PrtD family type I secretion system ABC transporter